MCSTHYLESKMILDFGKHKGTALENVPNDYLGWLTKWDVGWYCSCGDEECDDDCKRPAKLRRVVKSRCKRETWVGGELETCSCSICESLKFLDTRPDIIKAARELATSRKLCSHCWKVMPPVGNSREGGKFHDDWRGRCLHKKCWRELQE